MHQQCLLVSARSHIHCVCAEGVRFIALSCQIFRRESDSKLEGCLHPRAPTGQSISDHCFVPALSIIIRFVEAMSQWPICENWKWLTNWPRYGPKFNLHFASFCRFLPKAPLTSFTLPSRTMEPWRRVGCIAGTLALWVQPWVLVKGGRTKPYKLPPIYWLLIATQPPLCRAAITSFWDQWVVLGVHATCRHKQLNLCGECLNVGAYSSFRKSQVSRKKKEPYWPYYYLLYRLRPG